jgi:hypothetical protein
MASELQYPFTPEQIAEQGQGNLVVVILGGIAYAKSQGRDPREFGLYVGKLVISGWASINSPREAATAVALNCASMAMSIVSIEGDDTRGELVTGDWPDPNFLQLMGLTQADADRAWSIFEPIAQSVGYTFSFQRDGAQLHFTFAK